MEWTEQTILLQAPNPAAAENGRKLSRKGSFSARCKTADGGLYWAQCAGSGKNPYRVSIDLAKDGRPVCRCSSSAISRKRARWPDPKCWST